MVEDKFVKGEYCVTVMSHSGKYSSYVMDFKDDRHFSNWYKKVCLHGKVIGVEPVVHNPKKP